MLRTSLLMSVAFAGYILAASLPKASIEGLEAPPVVKACGLAYADFKKRVEVTPDNTTPLGTFISNVNNYKILIIPSKEAIVVRFSPQEFNGSLIRGGGYVYTLDANGKRIVNLELTR
jgi:hypothetical protein